MSEFPFGSKDQPRLNIQREVIRTFMLSRGGFYTLKEIEDATGYPQASISAQLRHLKKAQYGGYTLKKERKGEDKGTWYYQIIEAGFLFSTKESTLLNVSENI